MAERIEYCFRVAGGVREISKATGLAESLLYRYRRPGASRRTNVLSSIATAAKVSEAWLLTGVEVDPSKAVARPAYHSAFDLPNLLSAESQMDAAARAREAGGDFKSAEVQTLMAEMRRLAARIESLESKLASRGERSRKKSART
jgi:hypothetical protein